MADLEMIHHWHECPVAGCHKRERCTNPECARWYFKNCSKHAAAAPAKVVAIRSPRVVRTRKPGKPTKVGKPRKAKSPGEPGPPAEPAAPEQPTQ